MIFALLACTGFWIAFAAALYASPIAFYLAISAAALCGLQMLLEARMIFAGAPEDPKKR